MPPRFYDAHNHLQDDRLAPWREEILAGLAASGIVRLVVNGSCEGDWPAVRELARRSPAVIPSFGYHPWHVRERTPDWQRTLTTLLDESPAAVGEIGLDRWIEGHDLEDQAGVFEWQLRLAAERNLPVSIHCLQAWGRLLEMLQSVPLPRCGFLLHSYGGPAEMVGPLARLGARFSLPGYFAHERKERHRETFRQIPFDRLLIETDAPDQTPPAEWILHPLGTEAGGRALNHPGNLPAIYRFAAELWGTDLATLAEQVERNFWSLFGGVASPPAPPHDAPECS
jgi:TatD DNase family protein